MIHTTVRRILQIIPTLLILSLLVFYGVRTLPGTAEDDRISFTGENATHKKYIAYITGIVTEGDFGRSMRTRQPVRTEILNRYPYTLGLALGGIAVAGMIGIFLGIIASIYYNSLVDRLIMVLSLITTSMPLFFLGVMLMLFFCVYLGWLPSRGIGSWDSAILPILTLGLPAVGYITRTTRSSMLEVLSKDYIRASVARGIPEKVTIYVHAFRNTWMPIMTAVAVRFGELLAGTVLVENAFSIPGLGRLVLDAIIYRDYTVLMGCILCLAATFLLVNIVIDILYTAVDPRIRYGR